jgi:8-oxo-dGTP pyrophosphatase MutT (NUDIX family)
MSIARKLRDALRAGAAGSPELLERDQAEPPVASEQPPMPAAVLIAIVDRPEPGVILTMRPDAIKRHAGQIAFPGGRIDACDDGAIAAALREAEEEIGLPPAEVEIIGVADSYRTVTGFIVTPVLGVIPPDLPLRPHPDEVAAIFEAPLRYLLEPSHQIVRSVEWQGRQRSYYEIEWEGWRIWGATAAMIVNLGRRLALTP